MVFSNPPSPLLLLLHLLPLLVSSQLIENYVKANSDHRIKTLSNGYLARVWTVTNDTAGSIEQLWIQSFNEENQPQSTRILVDQTSVKEPSIGILSNGAVIITYTAYDSGSAGRDGNSWGVMMSECASDLSSCNSPVVVNTDEPIGNQQESEIGIFDNGDFVVAWRSGDILRASLFDQDLNRIGSEQEVSAIEISDFTLCIPNDQTIFFVYRKKNVLEQYIIRYDKTWSQVGSVEQVAGDNTFYKCTGRADGMVAMTRIQLAGGENLFSTIYDGLNNELANTQLNSYGGSQYECSSLVLHDNTAIVTVRTIFLPIYWEGYLHFLDEDFQNPGPRKKISRGKEIEDRATDIQIAQFGSGKIGLSYLSDLNGYNELAIGTICRYNSECDPLVAPVCTGLTCELCTVDEDCDADPALPFCETIAGVCSDEELSISVVSTWDDICQTGEIEIEVSTNFTNPSFTVTVVSSIGDTVNEANIDAHLSSFNTPGTATIPSEYFKADASYTFTVESKRTEQVVLVMDPDELFKMSSSSAIINEYLDEDLSFGFTLLNCVKATPLSKTWNQDEGPSFAIPGYVSESALNTTHTQFTLNIPKCLLEPSTDYIFIQEAYISASPIITASINITIATKRLPIAISISSVTQVESKNALDLIAIAAHNCPAITDDDLDFKWKCEKKGSDDGAFFTDCQDPNSLFNQYESGESTLQIPANYYDPEETLKLALTVKHVDDTTTYSDYIIQITSYLDINLQTLEVRRCSIRLILDYDQIEQQYSNMFVWELLSTHTDTEKMEDLQDFMSTISVPSIVIPQNLIEIGAEYSIQASYTNFKGNLITQIIDLDPVPEIPVVTFEGGYSQVFNSHTTNTIKAQTECFPEGLFEEWRFESGPESFVVEEYVSEFVYNWVELPKCMLIPDSSYRISYIITSDSTSEESINEVELQINSQPIQLQIDGANSYHIESEDLELAVQLITPGNCEVLNKEDFTYEWTCQKYDLSLGIMNSCPDLKNLFVSPYDTNILVIPDSYFEKDENLRLELVVHDGLDEVASTVQLIQITDQNIFKLTMSCQSEFECIYFSPQVNYRFEANITNKEEGFQDLRVFWSLSPSFNLVQFVNQLKTSQYPYPYFEHDSTQPMLSVSFQAENDTHKSIINKIIPINFSPENGDITITPKQGTIMQTQFIIETSGWTDPDLPFEYQYFVANMEEEEDSLHYRPLTQFIRSSVISTILSTTKLDQTLANLDIKAVVRDAYGASNYATTDCGLYIIKLSIEDEVKLVENQLSIISQLTDPTEKSKQIAVVSSHISNLEEKIKNQGDEQSCTCSDRGACIDQQCECTEGFTLSECQLSETELEDIRQTKFSILEIIEQNLQQISSEDQSQELAFQSLNELSSNPDFNTEASINKTKLLMDELISKDDGDVIISIESAKYVSSILDNLLTYQIKNDCSTQSEMTQSIKNDLEAYITKISEGLRSGKIANEDPEVVIEDTFSAQSQIVTECSIEDIEIQTDENAPEISFQSILEEPDCLKSLDLNYFAFQDDMFDCANNGSLLDGTKDIVMISLTDSVTGENVTSDYDVFVSRSWNETCYDGCQKIKGKQEKCLCGEDSSLFDIAGQISSLFEQTNFDEIFNIDISEWQVYDSAMFWVFVVMSLLTIGSSFLIKKKLIDYCFIENAKQNDHVKGYQIFTSVFLVNHSLLNCFMIKSMKPDKIPRLAVFYTRLMVMMLVVSALGSSSGLSFGLRRQLQDISLSLDIYILLVPYFTFIPVELVLVKLLILGGKAKDSTLTSKQRRVFKALNTFAYTLMVLVTIFCIFAIISIGESLSTEENLETAGFFGRTLAQDWIITPLIFMILMAFIQDDQINSLVAKHKKTPQKKTIKNSQIAPLQPLDDEQSDNNKLVKPYSSIKGQVETNIDTEHNNNNIQENKKSNSEEIIIESSLKKATENSQKVEQIQTEQGLIENEGRLDTRKSLLDGDEKAMDSMDILKNNVESRSLGTLQSLSREEIIQKSDKIDDPEKNVQIKSLEKGKIMMSVNTFGEF